MNNSPEYIIMYFAVLRAGGIVVPVNTYLTHNEIAYILKDSECRILVYGRTYAEAVKTVKKEVLQLKALTFDEVPEQEMRSYAGRGDDVAVFLYTSGTTGMPKAAMLTHANLLSNADACMKSMGVSHRDRIMLFLPLFHAFTFTVCVILPVYAGAVIVLLPSLKPFSRVVKSIVRHRITYIVAVPAVYNILARKRLPLLLKYLFRLLVKVKACISGASPLPERTIYDFEERFRVPLIEGYGLTEASPVVAVNPLNGLRKPGSVGPPLPGIEAVVVGEDGQRLPAGETGELVIKGPGVMKGYYNREEGTAEVLRDGWLYTGDMAKIDDDGYIYIVDRKKDLIIVDGMNVYPREVEDVVMSYSPVEECAMVGIPDGRGSEVPLLFVRKKDNAELPEDELRRYMKERLARFKIPRRIKFVDEFPRTATGKIKKTELRKSVK